MGEERYEDYGPLDMSLRELARLVIDHDKILVRGNGNSMVSKVNSLEEFRRDRLEPDLYDPESGIVPQMRDFLAVQAARAQESSGQLARWGTGIAILAVGTPIVWDYVKHALGWVAR